MIRYSIDENDLLARIKIENTTWLDRAADRTRGFRRARRYDETNDIWGEVKSVYMALQGNKCAYCERLLEGPPYGSVEHDMEHFRPKRAVPIWPDAQTRAARKIRYRFSTGAAHPRGYYLLAYAPLNYAAACKVCNTPLKSSFFPIAANRKRPSTTDVRAHASEEPLLLYPIGDIDADDPEALITFDGLIPVPRYRSGSRRRRAVVTIDFFELDTREDLLRGRANKIFAIYLARQNLGDRACQSGLRSFLSPRSAHTSCSRAFDALCVSDPARARSIFEEAARYLESQS